MLDSSGGQFFDIDLTCKKAHFSHFPGNPISRVRYRRRIFRPWEHAETLERPKFRSIPLCHVVRIRGFLEAGRRMSTGPSDTPVLSTQVTPRQEPRVCSGSWFGRFGVIFFLFLPQISSVTTSRTSGNLENEVLMENPKIPRSTTVWP